MNLWENYKAKTRALKMKRIISAVPPVSLPPLPPVSSMSPVSSKKNHVAAARGGGAPPNNNANVAQLSRGFVAPPQLGTKKNATTTARVATPNLTTPTAVMKKTKKPLPIDGRLDLHGMTADQGFAALDAFFYRMRANRCRYLLIITGKGTGVMKRTLQQFLERQQSIIASHHLADHAHGGEGAHYIVLKKSAVAKI